MSDHFERRLAMYQQAADFRRGLMGLDIIDREELTRFWRMCVAPRVLVSAELGDLLVLMHDEGAALVEVSETAGHYGIAVAPLGLEWATNLATDLTRLFERDMKAGLIAEAGQ